MSELSLLPDNWVWAKLGHIAGFVKGKKPQNIGTRTSSFNIPYIDIEAFERGIINRFTDGKNCSFCEPNDVLIVWDGARCGLVGKGASGAIGSTIAKLVCKQINPSYLYYFLLSKYNFINKRPRGVGIPHVEPNIFWNLHFPLAPLNEQGRIVARVEKLFSFLDAGDASLRVVQAQLKRYRQAVLKAAFEGKLTERWRRSSCVSVEPAADLLDRIFEANKIAQGKNQNPMVSGKHRQTAERWNEKLEVTSTENLTKLPEKWVLTTADRLFWKITSGSRWWAKYYSDQGALFIRVGDLSHDRISLNLIDAQHVNPPYGAELKRTRVSSGDILISITADIGRIALVPEGVEEAYVNQHVALAKSVSLFDRSYLAWYLISPSGQAQLTNLQYGATKAGLGLEDIGRVKVPFPPLVEQRLVVEEIERILASTKETKQALLGNLKRSQTLRESILKTAFEGRLVPQDPTDDPAEKLLELIKSERLSNKSKNSQTELSNYVK